MGGGGFEHPKPPLPPLGTPLVARALQREANPLPGWVFRSPLENSLKANGLIVNILRDRLLQIFSVLDV